MADGNLQHEIEQFYYREAELLDSRRLYEWLDLFSDDCSYALAGRLQSAAGAVEPPSEPRLIYHARDDKQFLTLRVKRLDTGFAHVEEPPSFTRRIVGNVQIENKDRPDGRYAVSANVMIVQFRETASTLFAGRRNDELLRVEGGWRIASRVTILDHVSLPRIISILF